MIQWSRSACTGGRVFDTCHLSPPIPRPANETTAVLRVKDAPLFLLRGSKNRTDTLYFSGLLIFDCVLGFYLSLDCFFF